jgi:hypothetical protein
MSATSVQGTSGGGVQITQSAANWMIRRAPGLCDLVGTVKDAASFSPLDWPKSLIGKLGSIKPEPHSEYQLLSPRDFPQLVRFLTAIVVPSVPGKAPGCLPAPFSTLLFHRSHKLKDAGRARGAKRFGAEQWFFINGILTNQDVARMNADYLVELFARPVAVLWNSTDGAAVDLLECLTEELGATGEDVDSAFHPLLDAIANPRKKRIVLISHSQGTLITAVLLRLIGGVYLHTMAGTRGQLSAQDREAIRSHAAEEGLTVNPRRLKPVTATELAKLEVYCFANCAIDMKYIDPNLALPTIESLATSTISSPGWECSRHTRTSGTSISPARASGTTAPGATC